MMTAECTMVGSEARFTTFDGQTFTFPGKCTYTLLESVHQANDLSVSTPPHFSS